jgi:hypothetical protein
MTNATVAMFVFNRPQYTKRVFSVISKAQPRELLIIADGPRNDKESALCQQTRAETETVDWPCEVSRLYSDANLGCRSRMASGLDWVFRKAPMAIILEDDCLPQLSFFQFCDELLLRFENDERVGLISGSAFHNGGSSALSYRFSNLPFIWGWAAWRRTWQQYDVTMKDWPEVRQTQWLHELLSDSVVAEEWQMRFDHVYQKSVDTWDYQFIYSLWRAGFMSITPGVHLVKNIGFGKEATHTRGDGGWIGWLKAKEIRFPLVHPDEVRCDEAHDKRLGRDLFGHNAIGARARISRKWSIVRRLFLANRC